MQRCDPPISNIEVFNIARSMMQYSPSVETNKLRITKH